MTKHRNDLVLEGNEIKARIHAEQIKHRGYVHTDWVRFTVHRRNAPLPSEELLFPRPEFTSSHYHVSDHARLSMCMDDGKPERRHQVRLANALREMSDSDQMAGAQAFEMAKDVASILGADFMVDPEVRKGKDFYRHRLDILRKGHPVGWVGFLSTSAGSRGDAQSQTLHVNLEGMACTFAQTGWRDTLADYIDQHRGLLTRIDLAVDFFDGIAGGMERFRDEYKSGLMDHLGQRPGHRLDGTWDCDDVAINKGRSFYLGNRASGKLTNIYEKGLQLYGPDSSSQWTRFELRYGNQKRLLPTDMLRRPADFFAGASDWHTAILREHGAQAFPEPIPCEARLPVQTIEAEVERNARWFIRTAGASACLAIKYLDEKTMFTLLDDESRIPGRLRKFSMAEVKAAYLDVFKRISSKGRAEPAFA